MLQRKSLLSNVKHQSPTAAYAYHDQSLIAMYKHNNTETVSGGVF
jgi:hypothetical protein